MTAPMTVSAFRSLLHGAALLGAFLPAIAEEAKRSEAAKLETAELGGTRNVHRCGDIILAGQFGKDDIETLEKRGIERVITLRTDGELDWNEGALVKSAGIDFIALPFRSPESLTDEVFARARELLGDRGKKTLLHCASANRVGAVWLPFRVLDEDVDVETALREAKEAGLRGADYERKALDYIERARAKAKAPKEDSVRPGINDSFLDPKLEVGRFIERFEVESREIYSAREAVLAACEIEPGQVVADIGAGTGLYTRLFSRAVGDEGWVFAVEITPRFIEHIYESAEEQGLRNITGVLCRQDSARLQPRSIDVAFVCDTYHHLEYPRSTLASISRALKPGGRLIVIDFERIEGESREWLLDHVRAGKDVVRAEIEAAGFELIAERDVEGLEENYFLSFRKRGK